MCFRFHFLQKYIFIRDRQGRSDNFIAAVLHYFQDGMGGVLSYQEHCGVTAFSALSP